MTDILDIPGIGGASSSWDSNPIIAAWRRDVNMAGGRALPTGYPSGPDKGAPAAVFLTDPDLGWAEPGNRRYELAPVHVRLAVGWERSGEAATLAAGKAAETASGIVEATGLDKGVFGVLGKVTGIPPGVLITVAILTGAVIGYAALVNAGIAPPIRELTKGK